MDFNNILEYEIFNSSLNLIDSSFDKYNSPDKYTRHLTKANLPFQSTLSSELSFNKDNDFIRKRKRDMQQTNRKQNRLNEEYRHISAPNPLSSSEEENQSLSIEFPSTHFNEQEVMLYENSDISLNEFLMIFIKFKTSNKLKDNLSVSFLKLIKALLPQPNNCPVSLQFIFNTIDAKQEADHHQICEHKHIWEKLDYKKNISNDKCDQCNKVSSFITFNISQQVDEILDKNNLFNQIKRSNMISDTSEYVLEKQTDGSIYKEYRGTNSSEIVVSLNINSDGAPLCESTKHNIWPLLATIVELENSSREKFENMIFLGN